MPHGSHSPVWPHRFSFPSSHSELFFLLQVPQALILPREYAVFAFATSSAWTTLIQDVHMADSFTCFRCFSTSLHNEISPNYLKMPPTHHPLSRSAHTALTLPFSCFSITFVTIWHTLFLLIYLCVVCLLLVDSKLLEGRALCLFILNVYKADNHNLMNEWMTYIFNGNSTKKNKIGAFKREFYFFGTKEC